MYSTCTSNPAENEEMVTWALETLPCLEPVRIQLFNSSQFRKERIAYPFSFQVPLNISTGSNTLLFGHPKFKDQLDTISFYIAKFRKKF